MRKTSVLERVRLFGRAGIDVVATLGRSGVFLLRALLCAGCQRLELGGQLRQVFHSFAEQLAALVRVAAQLTCQFFEH